jgi:retron-type reverse transcriptase
MKIEQEHIERIRGLFAKMQTREDLLYILNEANAVIHGRLRNSIPLRLLTLYSKPEIAGKCYSKFEIKKKSGGVRQINAPGYQLRYLQKLMSFVLQCVFEPHHAAYGFVWNKSIADNANKHKGQRYVYNIDLKDFFSSVDHARVWKCLQLQPFNLNVQTTAPIKIVSDHELLQHVLQKRRMAPLKRAGNKRYIHTDDGTFYLASTIPAANELIEEHERNLAESTTVVPVISRSRRAKPVASRKLKVKLEPTWFVNRDPQFDKTALAYIIANLCCAELEVERMNESGEWQTVKRRVLPQGAPTSPVLTNVVCQRLDHILTGVAKRFGLVYTRYADDITFSSMHNVYQPGSEFINELHRVIADQGFHIKESKTRLQKQEHRQEVTGLVVNEQVNVSKSYIKELRMWLNYWERYGYNKASSLFRQNKKNSPGRSLNRLPLQTDKEYRHLANVIEGKLAYLAMVKGLENSTYIGLKTRFDRLIGAGNKINNILQIWENQGIENAIDKFEDIFNRKNQWIKLLLS